MHRSRRVSVGIRGGPTVNSCHADAQRAQISSPWKRSKNRVVKDEWVLQTGALSPTFPFGKEGRDIQAQVRAHTSQGFHDRPQSPFSHASGHGASHHPVDPLKVQGSLSTIQLSTSQFSHTSSADGHKQPPTLWVQDRYFMRPKTQSTYKLRERGAGVSQYGKHTVLVGGELSASWFSQIPPMLWPAKVGQTKPLNKTRDTIDVSDPEYLRGLGAKFQADMSGRVTCILSQSEKTLRHTRLKKEEADEVASLRTPRTAQDEQILEAALRQLQGDGPMERVQAELTRLDTLKTNKIVVDVFSRIMEEQAGLEQKHIQHLIRAAGTDKGSAGEVLVRYRIFLDILRISRNRKMAALQRAKVLQRRGLKRWQSNSLVRIISSWRAYTKSRAVRRTEKLHHSHRYE